MTLILQLLLIAACMLHSLSRPVAVASAESDEIVAATAAAVSSVAHSVAHSSPVNVASESSVFSQLIRLGFDAHSALVLQQLMLDSVEVHERDALLQAHRARLNVKPFKSTLTESSESAFDQSNDDSMAHGPALLHSVAHNQTPFALHTFYTRFHQHQPFFPSTPNAQLILDMLLSRTHDNEAILTIHETEIPLSRIDKSSSSNALVSVQVLKSNATLVAKSRLTRAQVVEVARIESARLKLAAQREDDWNRVQLRRAEAMQDAAEANERAAVRARMESLEVEQGADGKPMPVVDPSIVNSLLTPPSTEPSAAAANRTAVLKSLLNRGQMHRFGLSASMQSAYVHDYRLVNVKSALRCYQRAYDEFASVAAMHALGEMAMRGEGVQGERSMLERVKQSFRWPFAASKSVKSLKDAQVEDLHCLLGPAVSLPRIESNYTRAFALFQQAAEVGHAPAHHSLSLLYAWGLAPPHTASTHSALQQQEHHALSVLYNAFATQSHHALAKLTQAYRLSVEVAQTSSPAIYQAQLDSIATESKSAFAANLNVMQSRCEAALPLYRSVAKQVFDQLDKSPALRITQFIDRSSTMRLTTEGELSHAVLNEQTDVIQWHSAQCERADARACIALGYLHLHGVRGFTANPHRARELFCKTANMQLKQNVDEAVVMCAHLVLHGIGSTQRNESHDALTAARMFESLLPSQDDDRDGRVQVNAARAALGEIYLFGSPAHGVNHTLALSYLKDATDSLHPNAEAQYLLGLLYQNPSSLSLTHTEPVVTRKLTTALHYFTLSSLSSNIRAAFMLAQMHATGSGAVQSCHAALHLYKSVTDRSEMLVKRLRHAMQLMHQKRRVQAFHSFAELAEAGHAAAQWNCAVLLRARGKHAMNQLFDHLPANQRRTHMHRLALRYLKMAAEQGDVDAWRVLGDAHYDAAYSDSPSMLDSTAFTDAHIDAHRQKHLKQSMLYYRLAANALSPAYSALRLRSLVPLTPLTTTRSYASPSSSTEIDSHSVSKYDSIAHATFSLAQMTFDGLGQSSPSAIDLSEAHRLAARTLHLHPPSVIAVRLLQLRIVMQMVMNELSMWTSLQPFMQSIQRIVDSHVERIYTITHAAHQTAEQWLQKLQSAMPIRIA